MPRLNQQGVVSFLTLLILLGGIVAGTYLVQQRTNLFPQAAKKKFSQVDKNQKQNKDSDVTKKIKTANKKILKAVNTKDDDLFIAATAESTSANAQLNIEILKAEKGSKNKKQLRKLQELKQKSDKQMKIVQKHVFKIKDKQKFEKNAQKIKAQREKDLQNFDEALTSFDLQVINFTSQKALESSILAGVADAQKDLKNKYSKASRYEHSLAKLIHLLLPTIYASSEDAKRSLRTKEEAMYQANDNQEVAYDKIEGKVGRGKHFGPNNQNFQDYNIKSHEAYQAGYDYGYAYGEVNGIEAAKARASALEETAQINGRELTAAEKGELDGLAASIDKSKPAPGDGPGRPAESLSGPNDGPVAGHDETKDTFGGQQDDDPEGSKTGSDNPGLE